MALSGGCWRATVSQWRFIDDRKWKIVVKTTSDDRPVASIGGERVPPFIRFAAVGRFQRQFRHIDSPSILVLSSNPVFNTSPLSLQPSPRLVISREPASEMIVDCPPLHFLVRSSSSNVTSTMFKYLVIVFVLSYAVLGYAAVNHIDSRISGPNILSDQLKLPPVRMNGSMLNYHVGQQIFYVYGDQQLKKVLDNTKRIKLVESGYVFTDGIGMHKLHPRKITWNSARKICIDEGGHLAVINSDFEEKIFLLRMREKNMGSAWVGLHDLYEEGDWITVNDEAMENTGFSRWATKFANLPDNFGGVQHCAVLIVEGGLDDIDCKSTEGFFCEVSI